MGRSRPSARNSNTARASNQPTTSQAASSSATAAATSQHHDQPQNLAEWRERQRVIKEARVENGKRLQEKLQEMRSQGLLNTTKRQTMSQASGLEFPVRRIIKHMKELNPHRIVYESAGVMMSGVIEYLCAEVLELAGNTTKTFRKKRITPRDIFLAVKNDAELDKLLEHITIMQSGAVPNIHPNLLKTPKVMPTNIGNTTATKPVAHTPKIDQLSLAERVEHGHASTTRKTQA